MTIRDPALELNKAFRQYGNKPEEIAEILKAINQFLSSSYAQPPKPMQPVQLQQPPSPQVTAPTTTGTISEPFTWDWQEAAEYGVEIEEGWSVEVTPGAGDEVSVTLIDPDGWRITEAGDMYSPEGELFTADELADIRDFADTAEAAFPYWTAEETAQFMEQQPSEFWKHVKMVGHTQEVDALLREMELTDNEIAQVFGERYQWHIGSWGVPSWFQTMIGGEAGTGGLIGAMRAIDRWIPTGLGLQLGVSSIVLAEREKNGTLSDADVEFMEELGRIQQEEGEFNFLFSERSQAAFEEWQGFPGGEWGKMGVMAANPVWWLPIGGTIGFASRIATKIPIIGRSTRLSAAITMGGEQIAKAVTAAEKAVAYPITKPVEIAAKPVAAVGERVGEGLANKVIRESERFTVGDVIPVNNAIVEGYLVDNWMRAGLQFAAKAPPVRKGIESVIGKRVLVSRTAETIEDIVGRGAVIHGEIVRMGFGASVLKRLELDAIVSDPVKYFGFDDMARSQTMINRLKPQYRGSKEAGTLEIGRAHV